MHFVYISERAEGDLPPLEEVRARVTEEWEYQKRQEFKKAFEAELLARYEIHVETTMGQEQGDG